MVSSVQVIPLCNFKEKEAKMLTSMLKNHSLFIVTVCFGTTACQGGGEANPIPDVAKIPYGEGENQWMNLYLADSDTPTPLYLFSHANGSR